MPDTSPSTPPEATKHEGNIATVVGRAKDIDRKMAGQKAFKALLQHGRLLLSMVKDYVSGAYREVPYWAIGAGALALVYVLSPMDAIPDFFFGVGYIDDATVLAFCLKLIETELDRYSEWKNTREAEVEKA